MPRPNTDQLIQGARCRPAQVCNQRLVRLHRQGEYQQTWHLRRLLALLDVDLVLDAVGDEAQFARALRLHARDRAAVARFAPIRGLAPSRRLAVAHEFRWSQGETEPCDTALGNMLVLSGRGEHDA